MPIVHVELFEGRTKEQKAEFAKAVTEDAMRILGCKAEVVTIIFTDKSKEDWASAGTLVCDRK